MMNFQTNLVPLLASLLLLSACGPGDKAGTAPNEPAAAANTDWRDLNGNGQKEPYEDPSLPIGERVDDIIARMTLEQKLHMVSGIGRMRGDDPVARPKVPGAAGYTYALEALGIPSIVLADGPAGLRILPTRDGDEGTYYATAFPIATLLASTWDTDLVRGVGSAVGNEVREYGVDILLAPGMNIHRNPRGGRNFEYYSEDPHLNGHMAAAMIMGVQSAGVGATPKHYVANNQETNRHTVDTIVSERALREIYLRGFEIAVEEAHPWAIMSAYNVVNGTPASYNKPLLSEVLRDEWGFDGVVMTDWGAGSDNPVAQMRAGNELLMPGAAEGTAQIQAAIEAGDLDESVLDRNLRYILGVIMRTPAFNRYDYSDSPDLDEHTKSARIAAAEGTVLLKNNGRTLPLPTDVKTIAAFGNTSYDFVSGGTGSGDVNEAYTVSLVQGLEARGIEIDTELESRYEAHNAAETAKMPPPDSPFRHRPPPPEMNVTGSLAADKAASADLALITIGRNSGEGRDRPVEADFYLADTEQALITNVSAAFHEKGKKVIVILNIGNVIETASWRDLPDAIVVPWQGGQEAGNAIVDVLTGDIDPSGKLPTSFPVNYSDVPSSDNFPGVPTGDKIMVRGREQQPSRVDYQEGIFVGYRYYDSFGIAPAYEFGYGLSYTDFDYGELSLDSDSFEDSINASVTVTNTGDVAGKEVVELYLGAPQGDLDKPVRELKGFAKTALLAPGHSETVQFALRADELASFDDKRSAWVAERGAYTVSVGASSRDIRATASFELPQEITAQEVVAELSPGQQIQEISP